MTLRLNRRQKENLAKYFYVVSQILLGTLVIENITKEVRGGLALILGVMSVIVTLLIALYIDKLKR